MSNNLINETSPYLLQHKNNPVNWYPWNIKSLNIVKNSNLPVLLSVGYSSCHWCHVMAHESFEDTNTAKIMNSNFINIKVDREERPDVDNLYQASLSLMGQQGGWPLTMFLDNELRPFWGGTYFPNVRRYGMPSFVDVLLHIVKIFKDKNIINNNSLAIKNALKQISLESSFAEPSVEEINSSYSSINRSFDPIYGGIGSSPKFPMIPLLRALFSTAHLANKVGSDSLKNIKNTLTSICLGGIYDHVGGGFSRYSTDDSWFVPHFEKMLYDNAQLIEALSVLFLLDPNPIYKDRINKTFFWLSSQMRGRRGSIGAYFSAMDADSEGKEGTYYLWDESEIIKLLKIDSAEFIKQYGVLGSGNWEGGNILNRINRGAKNNVDYELSKKNKSALNKLHKKRSERPLPLIDKKILTDWNCMLICGLIKSYISLENKDFYKEAVKIYSFIIQKHLINGRLFHSSCCGKLGASGNLDDYANLIRACFNLYEVDGDRKKLSLANSLVEASIKIFYDKNISDFYFSEKGANDLFVKTKNMLDGASQSGISIMLENLFKNYYYYGKKIEIRMFEEILKRGWGGVRASPTSYSGYLHAANKLLAENQIVLFLSKDPFGKFVKKEILKLSSFCTTIFFYNKSDVPKFGPSSGKGFLQNKSTVYVCRGNVCLAPISNVKDFLKWLHENTVF